MALASGCKKKNELPASFSGRYRNAQLLLADQFIVVTPRSLTVQACVVNCGAPVVNLTTVTCATLRECTYTSEHCTGSIELDSRGRLSITATPVPGATGEAAAVRNLTCSNIRNNFMPKAS